MSLSLWMPFQKASHSFQSPHSQLQPATWCLSELLWGAAITLVETGCQRFHAMAGMKRFNIPREMSMCAWTFLMEEPEVLCMEDLTKDAR